MSFDVIVRKAATTRTAEEARETYEATVDPDPGDLDAGTDLAAFLAGLRRRYPSLGETALLPPDPADRGRRGAALPRLRSTGASLAERVGWLDEHHA